MNGKKAKCSRGDECNIRETVTCRGCGFQHFDRIDDSESDILVFLKDRYFQLCLKNRKGSGGRVALDQVFKELVLKEAKKYIKGFPELEELEDKDLNDTVKIGDKHYKYRVKSDSSFKFNGKHIFVEIKGSGNDTNSILSAITAAQLVKSGERFNDNYKYYYLGCMSTVSRVGLTRANLLEEKRTKISPYVRWAEGKGFIKFYGIRDIEQLLKDIKEFCSQT